MQRTLPGLKEKNRDNKFLQEIAIKKRLYLIGHLFSISVLELHLTILTLSSEISPGGIEGLCVVWGIEPQLETYNSSSYLPLIFLTAYFASSINTLDSATEN